MTVVIADSSPLNYLTLIGSVDLLHRLYGVVVVPRQAIYLAQSKAERRYRRREGGDAAWREAPYC